MPRVVDHDQRRAELAAVVWSLIRERGLEGVTLRQITEKSGWSSGGVRHYLPNREAILTFAAQHLNERVEAHVCSMPFTSDLRRNLLDLLHLLLPLDEETRLWTEVWLAYLGAAVSDRAYADTQGILYGGLHEALSGIFEDFSRLGWLPAHTPAEAATQIHALLDGLSVHLLMGRLTPQQAKTTLERAADSLLVPPG